MIWRRHDRYILRSFLGILVTTLVFLSSLFVIYDIADRIDKLPKAFGAIARLGKSPGGALLEYYLTLLPFLWLRILPIAVLLAAGATLTWLTRQNELAPLVAAGVPTRRVLRPIFLAALGLAVLHTALRETVVPSLSRRHDDLHRLLTDPGKENRFQDVPHFSDSLGGRVSMAAYYPREQRMEDVWITMRHEPGEVPGRVVAFRFPGVRWHTDEHEWVAERGGQRRVLEPVETGTDAQVLPPGTPVALALDPPLLELTLRQGAAIGFSSAEIAALARANPDKARFTLLLHQQWAAPVSMLVMLLLGIPMVFHLGRGHVFRSFAKTLALIAAYFLVDSIVSDMGARGTLSPVLAAWAPHVVFGALGLALMSGIQT